MVSGGAELTGLFDSRVNTGIGNQSRRVAETLNITNLT